MDRRACLQFVAALCATKAFTASAEPWPNRAITLVSTSPAGGNADMIGRSLSPLLGAALNVPVVVDDKPGATGLIASAYVAKAAPDGYTLLLGSIATHATAPSLIKNLPYDVVRDFSPIVVLGMNSLVLAVPAKSPYRSVADIVTAAKADPGGLSFASPGIGGTSHLSGELFQNLAGIKLVHVPNARSPAYADVISGNATMIFEGSVALLPHIHSGLLRPIAVTSLTRSSQLPEVPTMVESGVKGFDVQSWQAVFGPAKVPAPVVERLYREFSKVLQTSDIKQRFEQLGITPSGMAPADFAEFQRQEIAKWSAVIKAANITVD